MLSLAIKVAIISGVSSGIGRAAALLFTQEGAKVVVGARRKTEQGTLVEEIEAPGGKAFAVSRDAREENYAEIVTSHALDRFGWLDVANNNVGGLGVTGDSTTITLDGWSQTLDVNLSSAFLGAKPQVPHLVAGGRGVTDLHLELRRVFGGSSASGGLPARGRQHCAANLHALKRVGTADEIAGPRFFLPRMHRPSSQGRPWLSTMA